MFPVDMTLIFPKVNTEGIKAGTLNAAWRQRDFVIWRIFVKGRRSCFC